MGELRRPAQRLWSWAGCRVSYRVSGMDGCPILSILWSGARITSSQPSDAIVHPSAPSQAMMARGLAHTLWMPGIAGSTPVARRGFSVMKPVSWATSSKLKARRVFFFHFEIMEGAQNRAWFQSHFSGKCWKASASSQSWEWCDSALLEFKLTSLFCAWAKFQTFRLWSGLTVPS